jgi:photosystem II stability/assembly factor-like uncharacterized protein
MRRTLSVLTIALVVVAAGAIAGSAASPKTPPSKQEIAKRILATPAGKALTPTARIALEAIARGDHKATPDSNGINAPATVRQPKGAKPGGGPLPNVRVNDPSKDSNQVDQTTQSETSIAVSGSNVAVGYNDSQRTLLVLTAASNISGVSYSTDGGQTFTDGGTIPNAPGKNNLGDPWLATDSAGTMYYSNLVLDSGSFSLLVGVAKSTDGGKSWSQATPIPPPLGNEFGYMADKDAMVAAGTGNLYDTWDDFTTTFDPNTGAFTEFSGLPVAHTTDGGSTWSIAYADKTVVFSVDPNKPPDAQDCSFHQYIGAMPLVTADGTVYEAALKFGYNDPTCSGTVPITEEEWIFASHDGGQTFPQKVKIADVSPSTGAFAGAFQLAPGQFMRNLEFPTLAAKDGSLYAAWNDGASGHSHVVLATSKDGGNTWKTSQVTEGNNDEAQPALSADSSGLHLLYYEISPAGNGTSQVDAVVSNAKSGSSWTSNRVTSQSFPGVYTLPQFDPIIALTYMGDYIANVSDGTHQYFAWGDNRDVVTNFLWPQGRRDPDVFFARQ